MRKVLVLGASGLVAPYVIPGLEPHYDLHLADIKPHPDDRPITHVDVTDYEQVFAAAHGVDAIMNFTVERYDPILSFEVNVKGAYHVMRTAAERGIHKVIHTGPELVTHGYRHDFAVDDVPQAPGTRYYNLTKFLSMETCRIYAREYGIQTVCFQFAGLGEKITEDAPGRESPHFRVVWEDVQQACRQALEIDSVPGDFQTMNLLSYLSQGKYSTGKAQRLLGYTPTPGLAKFFSRPE